MRGFYSPAAAARDYERARQFAAVDATHASARRRAVAGLPFSLRAELVSEWERESVINWHEATKQLNEKGAQLRRFAVRGTLQARAQRIEARDVLTEWACDATIKAWARRRAAAAYLICKKSDGAREAVQEISDYMQRWHLGEIVLTQPELDEENPRAYLARAACRHWWTRAARRMVGRAIEAAEIDRGRVHRRAGVYLSERNAARAKQAGARNAQLMMNMEATNELGETVKLAELSKGSVSNPWVRFSEMMVTIKGLEALAVPGQWSGLFVTWTLPSAYHARHASSGEENANYLAYRPRDGQARLQDQWQRARARCAKHKIKMFGLRVAEPHHDGTPHWHMMIWVEPAHAAQVLEILRALALEESPEEFGAQKHRCKVEAIDPAKGGAASYLAKYVSKMTTGAGLGMTSERGADGERREVGKPSASAQRARWWASLHGIRQFQFFGIPPRGIWREARRMRDPLTGESLPGADAAQFELFERVRATADAGDYAGHVAALGGVAIKRKDCRVQVFKRQTDQRGRYGDVLGEVVKGLCLSEAVSIHFVTRLHEWILRPCKREESAPPVIVAEPWTRGNNCYQGREQEMPKLPDTFPTSGPTSGPILSRPAARPATRYFPEHLEHLAT